MDTFPSVETLINGCKSPVGVTERWDVVVSYSLPSLNRVLQRLWTNSITSTTTELITVSTNEDDEEYHTKWWLRLGAPTLQFTHDGKASLRMPLDGKRQVVEKTAAGKERPVREIPPNTYSLFAVIPLGVGSSGKVIRFDDDPDAELHVVVNFQTTTAEGAVYSIGLSPEYQSPEGSKPAVVTDDFSVGLRDKLAAWIADPENVSSIQYALAVVNKKPVPDASYLTPESLSFSVYSSPNDKSVACLSVYMQTQGSGFEPGNVNRNFTLPAAENTNSFPIPKGYTASIIIRHDVFAQKFLRDSMLALHKDGKRTFNSVRTKPSLEGFELTASINSGAVADLGNSQWFGGSFHTDKVNWDFGASELSLNIKDSNSSWGYYFKPQLEWSQTTVGPRFTHVTWGKTNYEMKLDKSGLALFKDASDVGLSAQIGIKGDDWQRTASAWSPGFWERANGAIGSVPGQVERGLKKIDLPTFLGQLNLEYFATTNVFAPGKHMLSVGSASDVYTPYDVIILGNVVETSAMTPPTFPGQGREFQGMNAANMRDIKARI
ncbi:hypothetical protein NM208_g9217 [Fusarium decemcellulare]|uniref:Uncharacterized protein n=1 Tax=Fusarium decemcellulare TaxID=57161 RepID=A0ACC1S2F1_9HYPO|nr:hypothetical protein NM208_g9217 [Fusarium decemcellulare]